MNNIEILENLIAVIKAQNSFNDVDMALLKGINRIINERWITIHPHGEDSEDYRRIKLEDGETPKEAIDRIYKKEDKKEKSEEELKKEKKQLYQDILKAKKEGDKERHHKLLERYYEIDSILKGDNEPKKEEKNEVKGNGLLPQYANDFFTKKEAMQKAKERWHQLLAEYQVKATEDSKFKEFSEKINEIYKKMSELRTYSPEFQALINEKNKILDQKQAYANEFYKEVYAAQHEYSELDVSTDKKDIIRKMSDDIKDQIKKISKNNDALVKKFDNLKTLKEIEDLTTKENKLKTKQDAVYDELEKLSFDDPQRAKLRDEWRQIGKERGEIKNAKREAQYKTALAIGELLQVKDGVVLNTKCSTKMQDVTDRLKKCLDGVIPPNNFNNEQMTVHGHSGRAYQSGSTIYISSNEEIGTAIHETMHHLEEHSDHVLMNSLAFASSRTPGEKQESLKRLTGLNYKRDEVCKKDNFFNPYCGKLYDVFGGRNKSFETATASEIMSMGVQELFTNPKEFAKNDREYFDFVVANLQGKLWN